MLWQADASRTIPNTQAVVVGIDVLGRVPNGPGKAELTESRDGMVWFSCAHHNFVWCSVMSMLTCVLMIVVAPCLYMSQICRICLKIKSSTLAGWHPMKRRG